MTRPSYGRDEQQPASWRRLGLGRLVRRALYWSGLAALARHTRIGDGAAILVYHGVTTTPITPPEWRSFDYLPTYHIPADLFAQHLRYLSRRALLLPLTDVLAMLEEGTKLPRSAVCVTFDDGLRNVATNACPLLRQYGVPATIFVTVAAARAGRPQWDHMIGRCLAAVADDELEVRIGGRRQVLPLGSPEARVQAARRLGAAAVRMKTDERERWTAELMERTQPQVSACSENTPMSPDEIRSLATDPLITIGSHTMTHIVCSRSSPERVRREFAESRAVLEEMIHRPVTLLAYPFGGAWHVGDEAPRLAEQAGYSGAVSMQEGRVRPGVSRFALPRYGVGSELADLCCYAFGLWPALRSVAARILRQ